MPIPIGVLAQAGAGGVQPFVPISDAYVHLQTITADGGSSFTFSNLDTSYSATYKHLELRFNTSNRSSQNAVYLQFNGDSGSNYSYHRLFFDSGASLTADATTSSTSMFIGTQVASSPDDVKSASVVRILDAFNTNKSKTIISQWAFLNSQLFRDQIYFTSGAWRNNNALTSINISTDGAWFYTSRISLYGIKG
jgi:hypothetical protein